jgi:hypothetical protein
VSDVRIEVTGQFANVYSAYDELRLSIIRELRVRRWSKTAKCWVIEASQVDALKYKLEISGDTVLVTYPAGPTPPAGDDELRRVLLRLQAENTRLRNEAAARNGNWAEVLLGQCSPELAEKVHRQLTRALHPDVGGSHELMRDLNVARDLLGERGRR